MMRATSGLVSACMLAVFALALTFAATVVHAQTEAAKENTKPCETTTVTEGGKATTKQTGDCSKKTVEEGKAECPKANYQSATGGAVTCYSDTKNCQQKNYKECSSDEMQKVIKGDGSTPTQGASGSQSGSSPPLSEQAKAAQDARNKAQEDLQKAQEDYAKRGIGSRIQDTLGGESEAAKNLREAQAKYDAAQKGYADQLNQDRLKQIAGAQNSGIVDPTQDASGVKGLPGSPSGPTPKSEFGCDGGLCGTSGNPNIPGDKANLLVSPYVDEMNAPQAPTQSALRDWAAGLRDSNYTPSPSTFSNNLGPTYGAWTAPYTQGLPGASQVPSAAGVSGPIHQGGIPTSPYVDSSGYNGASGYALPVGKELSNYFNPAPAFREMNDTFGKGWFEQASAPRLAELGIHTPEYSALPGTQSSPIPRERTAPVLANTLEALQEGRIPSDRAALYKDYVLDTVRKESAPGGALTDPSIFEQRPNTYAGVVAKFYEDLKQFATGNGQISAAALWDKTLKNVGVAWNASLRQAAVVSARAKLSALENSTTGGIARVGNINAARAELARAEEELARYQPTSENSSIATHRAQTTDEVFGKPSEMASNANRGIADKTSAAQAGSQSGKEQTGLDVRKAAVASAKAKLSALENSTTGGIARVGNINAAKAEVQRAENELAQFRAARTPTTLGSSKNTQVPGQGIIPSDPRAATQSTASREFARRAAGIAAITAKASAAEKTYIEALERAGLIRRTNSSTAEDPKYENVPHDPQEAERLWARVAPEREAYEKELAKYQAYEAATAKARTDLLARAGLTDTNTALTRDQQVAKMTEVGDRAAQTLSPDDVSLSTAGSRFLPSVFGLVTDGAITPAKFEITPEGAQRTLAALYERRDANLAMLESCTSNCENIADAVKRADDYIGQIETGKYTSPELIDLLARDSYQRPDSFGQLVRDYQASMMEKAADSWHQGTTATDADGNPITDPELVGSKYMEAAGYFALAMPGQVLATLTGQDIIAGVDILAGPDTSLLGFIPITGGPSGYAGLRDFNMGASALTPVLGAYFTPSPVTMLRRSLDNAVSSAGRFASNVADATLPGRTLSDISGPGFGGDFAGLGAAERGLGGLSTPPPVTARTAPEPMYLGGPREEPTFSLYEERTPVPFRSAGGALNLVPSKPGGVFDALARGEPFGVSIPPEAGTFRQTTPAFASNISSGSGRSVGREAFTEADIEGAPAGATPQVPIDLPFIAQKMLQDGSGILQDMASAGRVAESTLSTADIAAVSPPGAPLTKGALKAMFDGAQNVATDVTAAIRKNPYITPTELNNILDASIKANPGLSAQQIQATRDMAKSFVERNQFVSDFFKNFTNSKDEFQALTGRRPIGNPTFENVSGVIVLHTNPIDYYRALRGLGKVSPFRALADTVTTGGMARLSDTMAGRNVVLINPIGSRTGKIVEHEVNHILQSYPDRYNFEQIDFPLNPVLQAKYDQWLEGGSIGPVPNEILDEVKPFVYRVKADEVVRDELLSALAERAPGSKVSTLQLFFVDFRLLSRYIPRFPAQQQAGYSALSEGVRAISKLSGKGYTNDQIINRLLPLASTREWQLSAKLADPYTPPTSGGFAGGVPANSSNAAKEATYVAEVPTPEEIAAENGWTIAERQPSLLGQMINNRFGFSPARWYYDAAGNPIAPVENASLVPKGYQSIQQSIGGSTWFKGSTLGLKAFSDLVVPLPPGALQDIGAVVDASFANFAGNAGFAISTAVDEVPRIARSLNPVTPAFGRSARSLESLHNNIVGFKLGSLEPATKQYLGKSITQFGDRGETYAGFAKPSDGWAAAAYKLQTYIDGSYAIVREGAAAPGTPLNTPRLINSRWVQTDNAHTISQQDRTDWLNAVNKDGAFPPDTPIASNDHDKLLDLAQSIACSEQSLCGNIYSAADRAEALLTLKQIDKMPQRMQANAEMMAALQKPVVDTGVIHTDDAGRLVVPGGKFTVTLANGTKVEAPLRYDIQPTEYKPTVLSQADTYTGIAEHYSDEIRPLDQMVERMHTVDTDSNRPAPAKYGGHFVTGGKDGPCTISSCEVVQVYPLIKDPKAANVEDGRANHISTPGSEKSNSRTTNSPYNNGNTIGNELIHDTRDGFPSELETKVQVALTNAQQDALGIANKDVFAHYDVDFKATGKGEVEGGAVREAVRTGGHEPTTKPPSLEGKLLAENDIPPAIRSQIPPGAKAEVRETVGTDGKPSYSIKVLPNTPPPVKTTPVDVVKQPITRTVTLKSAPNETATIHMSRGTPTHTIVYEPGIDQIGAGAAAKTSAPGIFVEPRVLDNVGGSRGRRLATAPGFDAFVAEAKSQAAQLSGTVLPDTRVVAVVYSGSGRIGMDAAIRGAKIDTLICFDCAGVSARADSIAKWLKDNPTKTFVGVFTPEGYRSSYKGLIKSLQDAGLSDRMNLLPPGRDEVIKLGNIRIYEANVNHNDLLTTSWSNGKSALDDLVGKLQSTVTEPPVAKLEPKAPPSPDELAKSIKENPQQFGLNAPPIGPRQFVAPTAVETEAQAQKVVAAARAANPTIGSDELAARVLNAGVEKSPTYKALEGEVAKTYNKTGDRAMRNARIAIARKAGELTNPANYEPGATVPQRTSYFTDIEALSEDGIIRSKLAEVYLRNPVKRDSGGDFTYKDTVGALEANMSLVDYVIGGLDPTFRRNLYSAILAMEKEGIYPSFTAAYRGLERPAAEGFAAAPANSRHYNGGYGKGAAVDMVGSGAESISPVQEVRTTAHEKVWNWVDEHGVEYGIGRPYGNVDPPHVGPTGGGEYANRKGNPRIKYADVVAEQEKQVAEIAGKARTAATGQALTVTQVVGDQIPEKIRTKISEDTTVMKVTSADGKVDYVVSVPPRTETASVLPAAKSPVQPVAGAVRGEPGKVTTADLLGEMAKNKAKAPSATPPPTPVIVDLTQPSAGIVIGKGVMQNLDTGIAVVRLADYVANGMRADVVGYIGDMGTAVRQTTTHAADAVGKAVSDAASAAGKTIATGVSDGLEYVATKAIGNFGEMEDGLYQLFTGSVPRSPAGGRIATNPNIPPVPIAKGGTQGTPTGSGVTQPAPSPVRPGAEQPAIRPETADEILATNDEPISGNGLTPEPEAGQLSMPQTPGAVDTSGGAPEPFVSVSRGVTPIDRFRALLRGDLEGMLAPAEVVTPPLVREGLTPLQSTLARYTEPEPGSASAAGVPSVFSSVQKLAAHESAFREFARTRGLDPEDPTSINTWITEGHAETFNDVWAQLRTDDNEGLLADAVGGKGEALFNRILENQEEFPSVLTRPSNRPIEGNLSQLPPFVPPKDIPPLPGTPPPTSGATVGRTQPDVAAGMSASGKTAGGTTVSSWPRMPKSLKYVLGILGLGGAVAVLDGDTSSLSTPKDTVSTPPASPGSPGTTPSETSPTPETKLKPGTEHTCDADGNCTEVETGSTPPPPDKTTTTPPPPSPGYHGPSSPDTSGSDSSGESGDSSGSGSGGGPDIMGMLKGLLPQLQKFFGGQKQEEETTPTTGGKTPPPPPPATTTVRFSCDPTTILNKNITTLSWACNRNERSTGTGFDTGGTSSGSIQHIVSTSDDSVQFGVSCGTSPARMCTVYVLHPFITVVATPGILDRGEKSQINWAAVSVKECAVIDPDGAEIGRGASIGSVETPALTRSTAFAVVCSTDAGKPIYEYVPIIVNGDTTDPVKGPIPYGFMETKPSAVPSTGNTSNTNGTSNTNTTNPPTGTNTTTGNTTSPNTPPPGTYAATDANGNIVYLCDPEVEGIENLDGTYVPNQFTYCLTGGRWDCQGKKECYPSDYKGEPLK